MKWQYHGRYHGSFADILSAAELQMDFPRSDYLSTPDDEPYPCQVVSTPPPSDTKFGYAKSSEAPLSK